jgi:arginyl-tRNA synthetase
LLGKSAVAEGLQQGVFVQDKDKSVWIDLTADGLDRKILQRKDGTSVYITQDIGTAQLKYDDYKMDESIYVVGNEQDYHFKVLQLILKKLDKVYADGIYHLSYGMVELPSGKMKSREGTVVDADDLMDEMIEAAKQKTIELGKLDDGFSEIEKEKLFYTIGMGALKYFLLKVDPKKKMMFNPDESIELQGNTGPFIQYTHARICSILRNNKLQRISLEDSIKNYPLHSLEKALIQEIYLFPIKIEEAGKEHNPAVIANYVYNLAKEFNSFYTELSVLKAEHESEIQFRLHLVEMVAKVINKSMKLLGIEVPEKM